MPQKATNNTVESPAKGRTFEHKDTGEQVEVIQHMFDSEDDPTTPFVVQRQSDGQKIGFESPAQFYEKYNAVQKHRAENIDTIVVDPDDVVKVMERNKRDETEQHTHVLRVTPPFAGEHSANPHVSQDGKFYPEDVDAKPIHFTPENFLVGHSAGKRHPDFRSEWCHPDISEQRSLFRDEFDARGDNAENRPLTDEEETEWEEWWETSLEMWEGRVRRALKNTNEITLISQNPEVGNTTVEVRFENQE